MNATSPIIGRGIYPLREAARLAQINAKTAGRWATGNAWTHQGERRTSPGLVQFALPVIAGQRDLTFPELLTLRMVRAFKHRGLSLQTIKRVAEVAARTFETPAPFAASRFRTDGRKIFMELSHLAPDNDGSGVSKNDRSLVEVLSGQHQFEDVVEPSLYQNVDWEDDLTALRWWPMGKQAGVVLDPAYLFGAPRIAETRLPTAAVSDAVKAEGGGAAAIKAVADWYGIGPQKVEQAVKFESEWFKKAA